MGNGNENQKQANSLFGEPVDLAEEKHRLDAEQKANARFFKLEDGEMAEMNFTGKVYHATNNFGKECVYFELQETNDRGEHKMFSVGVRSGIVPRLVEQLLSGNLKLTLMRAGTGTQTQYTVVKQKQ